MKTYTKHHFGKWSEGKPSKGLLIASYQDGDTFNSCTRCSVMVKMGRKGGMKFWVGGAWVSKRPACQVSEH